MKPAPLTALCVTVLFGAFAPCARAEASAEGSRATLPVLTASLALELEREDQLLSRLAATNATTFGVALMGGVLTMAANGYRPSQTTSRGLTRAGATLALTSLTAALAVAITQVVRVRRRYRQLRRLGFPVRNHRDAVAWAILMPFLTPWPTSLGAMQQHRDNLEAVGRDRRAYPGLRPRAW